MGEPRRNPELKLQIFRNLPSEVIIDIISWLPIRSIGICKCVCKPWRDLLRTREFADLHLSRSASGLVICEDRDPENYKIFEFVDELGLESHELHYNPFTIFQPSMGFNGRFQLQLQGSANGLLLFQSIEPNFGTLFICNPITREYIELPDHRFVRADSAINAHGFGVSKTTGQHKFVKIFKEINISCVVYALGTATWRSVAPPAPIFRYDYFSMGSSLNGNIHWLVEVPNDYRCISCFDLEKETFSTFSPPPPLVKLDDMDFVSLVVLGDCLCVCDTTPEDDVVIWSMKEYGDEKSWTQQFVISKTPFADDCDALDYFVYPFKVFKDGDILMVVINGGYTFYYSNKTKTITQFRMFGVDEEEEDQSTILLLHTSSFLSLRSFLKESVSSF